MKTNQERDIIVINIMNTGSYLENPLNLGHEVINYFKADKSENEESGYYVYLNANGVLGKERVGKIKYVVNVRRGAVAGTHEIINVAKVLCDVEPDESSKIQYCGRTLKEIFSLNYEQQKVCVTFKAEGKRPQNIVRFKYIGQDKSKKVENDIIKENERLKVLGKTCSEYQLIDMSNISRNLRIYVEPSNINYNTLLGCIQDILNTGKEIPEFDCCGDRKNSGELNLIEFAGIENDELVYSNLLAFYFRRNHDLLNELFELAAEKFKLPKGDILRNRYSSWTDYKVEREHLQIDILVSDDEKNVIIENKIHSGINGIKHNSDIEDTQLQSQLSKYVDALSGENHDFVNIINTEGYKIKLPRNENRIIYGILLIPDYSKIENILNTLKYYECYTIIKYSELFNIFRKSKQYNTNEQFRLFTDFFLKYQSRIDFYDQEIIMRRRLCQRLRELDEIQSTQKDNNNNK